MVQARTSAKEFFNADERLADLGLIAVPGAEELTAKIDRHLLRWAQEAGMDQDTFIIESECPRFSSGARASSAPPCAATISISS